MINKVLLEQIQKYNPKNTLEIKNSMKEVLQDIILVSLGKDDFFKHVAFYGGTSLRIFRGLPRFSEDLDFTFIEENNKFSLNDYLERVIINLASYGIKGEIRYKEKKVVTTVESSYFCFNMKELFQTTFPELSNSIVENELLTIKIEVEKNWFEGGKTELKLLNYPTFSQIKTFTIETLFASKLIAVLNRKWKTRVKGRDYYDYLFYISKNVRVNIKYLENGLKKFGFLNENDSLNLAKLRELLKERFNNVDFKEAKNDVLPFIKMDDLLIEAFNKDIFLQTVDLIEII